MIKQESFITEIFSEVAGVGVLSDWKIRVKEMRETELIGTQQEQTFNLDISAVADNETFIATTFNMSNGYIIEVKATKIPLLTVTEFENCFQIEFESSLYKNSVEMSLFNTMIPLNTAIIGEGETQRLTGNHTHNDLYVCGCIPCEDWGNTKEQLEELINKSIGNSQYRLDKAADRAEHLTIIRAMGAQG